MHQTLKRSWRYLAILPALFACFIGVTFLSEWVRIGIIANPRVISYYYFGSEAMMSHGGWYYKSSSTYAWSAFIEGIFALCLGIFTFISSIKAKWRNAAIGCSIILILLLINFLNLWFL